MYKCVECGKTIGGRSMTEVVEYMTPLETEGKHKGAWMTGKRVEIKREFYHPLCWCSLLNKR